MDDNKTFESYRKDDGSTDKNRSEQMGRDQARSGESSSSQQSWESTVDYQNRQTGYNGQK